MGRWCRSCLHDSHDDSGVDAVPDNRVDLGSVIDYRQAVLS